MHAPLPLFRCCIGIWSVFHSTKPFTVDLVYGAANYYDTLACHVCLGNYRDASYMADCVTKLAKLSVMYMVQGQLDQLSSSRKLLNLQSFKTNRMSQSKSDLWPVIKSDGSHTASMRRLTWSMGLHIFLWWKTMVVMHVIMHSVCRVTLSLL